MNKNYPLRLSNKPLMSLFREENNASARDILKIAFSLFEAEKTIKDGDALDTIDINLSLMSYSFTEDEKLIQKIESVFLDILKHNIDLNVYVASNKEYRKSRKKKTYKKTDTLCLFSGGVDSFFGIFESKKMYKNLQGTFVAHSDQTGTINIFNKINETILKKHKILVKTINVPSIRPKKNKHGYSQLRGLLYILSCGALLNIYGGKNIIITECGTTMYQPLFGLYDSITHTTHPLVLRTANDILSKICNKKIDFILPYEDMTKAEIIASSEYNYYLPKTHSCISSRFRDHCGVCYGCVLRRLGSILVGVEDANYRHDVFSDEEVDDDNLISLLRFSYYYIEDKNRLPEYSLTKTKAYNKWDLFERQSLDVLSALYILKKSNHKFSKRMEKAYNVYVEPISKKKLEKRIDIVRRKIKKPNFKKII
ncbi:MAG: 7-cyano-7-deazaguanine synthase [Candidatus Woesearchaeota archaeon]